MRAMPLPQTLRPTIVASVTPATHHSVSLAGVARAQADHEYHQTGNLGRKNRAKAIEHRRDDPFQNACEKSHAEEQRQSTELDGHRGRAQVRARKCCRTQLPTGPRCDYCNSVATPNTRRPMATRLAIKSVGVLAARKTING